MEDITASMLEFKEALRHTWNSYFSKSANSMAEDLQDAFEAIEQGLFSAIVLSPLGMADRAVEYREHPLSFITVKPVEHLRELPLQICRREANGNTIVELPISVQIDEQTAFDFFDFFDWYPYGFIDLPYVRARVRDLSGKPSAKSSIVLIEQRYCRHLFTA
jgi:hypothetical protein